MINNLFSAKHNAVYQTIWIEDQAPHFVGPDLNPYCLQMPFKINIFLEKMRKYFHFIPDLLEGTVYNESYV